MSKYDEYEETNNIIDCNGAASLGYLLTYKS